MESSDQGEVWGRKKGYVVGLWKAIRKNWDLVRSKLSFVVSNGQRVKFWKDK